MMLLDAINKVSQRINGKNANEGMPGKNFFISMVNEAYIDICNMRSDWLFLKKSNFFEGANGNTSDSETSVTQTVLNSYDVTESTATPVENTISFKYSFSDDEIDAKKLNYIYLPAKRRHVGTGTLYTILYCDIYKNDTLIETSQRILISNNYIYDENYNVIGYAYTNGFPLYFYFDKDIYFVNGETYAIKFRITSCSSSGDYLQCYFGNGANTNFSNFSTDIGNNEYVFCRLIYTEKTIDDYFYIDKTKINKILFLESYDELYNKNNITLVEGNKNRLESTYNLDVFAITEIDEANQKIKIEYSRPGSVLWKIHYIAKPTELSSDTDNFLIPDEYCNAIVCLAEIKCLSRGYGLQNNLQMITEMYKQNINNMIKNLTENLEAIEIEKGFNFSFEKYEVK